MSHRRMSFAFLLFTFVFSSVLSFSRPAGAQGSEWVIPLGTETPVARWVGLSFPFVPDSSLTTGSLCTPQHPDFERYRYEEQIAYCGRNVSSAMKAAIYRRYRVSSHCKSEYTIDHFVPLALGGTNDFDNLWPEPKSIKALRYNLEYELYKRLNAGKISQADAVRTIIHAKLNPPVKDPEDFEFCR